MAAGLCASLAAGTLPAVASRFMLLYDDTNLYVGIKLQQTGAPVTATQSANDVGFGLDDFAGIGIDPSGNGVKSISS